MRLAEADNSASHSHGALRGNYRLHRGAGLSALVKTRGKCYLVLTYSLIPCAPARLIVSRLAPFTFSLDTVTHTVYSCFTEIDCAARRAPFSPQQRSPAKLYLD